MGRKSALSGTYSDSSVCDPFWPRHAKEISATFSLFRCSCPMYSFQECKEETILLKSFALLEIRDVTGIRNKKFDLYG